MVWRSRREDWSGRSEKTISFVGWLRIFYLVFAEGSMISMSIAALVLEECQYSVIPMDQS